MRSKTAQLGNLVLVTEVDVKMIAFLGNTTRATDDYAKLGDASVVFVDDFEPEWLAEGLCCGEVRSAGRWKDPG